MIFHDTFDSVCVIFQTLDLSCMAVKSSLFPQCSREVKAASDLSQAQFLCLKGETIMHWSTVHFISYPPNE